MQRLIGRVLVRIRPFPLLLFQPSNFHPPVFHSSAAWLCEVSSCDVAMADGTSTFGSFIGDAGDLDNDAPLCALVYLGRRRLLQISSHHSTCCFFLLTQRLLFSLILSPFSPMNQLIRHLSSPLLLFRQYLLNYPSLHPVLTPCCSTCSYAFCRLISAYSPLHN